ncbi:hypothetical protein HBB16_01805 [Pseudonocardia sp. MCCB 268]|nr:hypothetical protein [Pseudonocardia cytotoxica]
MPGRRACRPVAAARLGPQAEVPDRGITHEVGLDGIGGGQPDLAGAIKGRTIVHL